jgi:hypothetical protein
LNLKRFARLEADTVAELIETADDLSDRYHPSLDWREVTDAVEVGWVLDAGAFQSPPPPVCTSQPAPDLLQLQAELAALVAKFAAFKAG